MVGIFFKEIETLLIDLTHLNIASVQSQALNHQRYIICGLFLYSMI